MGKDCIQMRSLDKFLAYTKKIAVPEIRCLHHCRALPQNKNGSFENALSISATNRNNS